MKTSIIIPAYNGYQILRNLLWDLYKNCMDDIDEVVIVNDASTEEGFNSGLWDFWIPKNLLPISVIENSENLGFLKSANKGMADADGELLALISTDVRVQHNFIPEVKNIIEGGQGTTIVGNRYIDFDTGWNVFDRVYPYLEGWFLVCWENAWKTIQGFDERFSPNDYEDIDFSTSALSLGYTLSSINHPGIAHLGAQTLGYNPAREAITLRNKELFRQKWVK